MDLTGHDTIRLGQAYGVALMAGPPSSVLFRDPGKYLNFYHLYSKIYIVFFFVEYCSPKHLMFQNGEVVYIDIWRRFTISIKEPRSAR
jgi:hypothetical protein